MNTFLKKLKPIVPIVILGMAMSCNIREKEEAAKAAIDKIHDKTGLFKDQYDLSVPIANSRGAIVIVDLSKYINSHGGEQCPLRYYKYTVFIFDRIQSFSLIAYSNDYRMGHLDHYPSDTKIKDIAKSYNLLD